KSPSAIFRISPTGDYSTLYTFSFNTHFEYPTVTTLLEGADGNFYGCTKSDYFDPGTIFKLTVNGELTTLYSFDNINDYAYSVLVPSQLIQTSHGSLCGILSDDHANYGSIFELTQNGTFSMLYSFENTAPVSVIEDGDGNYYGVTKESLFRLSPSGNISILY